MKKIIYLIFMFTISRSYAQIDLSNGLVARFAFNGDATDATSHNFNGTLHGNASVNTVLKLGDNTSDYMTLPPAIMNGLDDFTIALKIRFKDLHTTGSFPTNHFITASGGSLDRIGISYQKSLNSWRAAINGQTNDFFDPNVKAGHIYCVCIMRSGNVSKIYVNENLLGTITTNTTPLSISSLLVGQEEDCSGGCFAQNQCMYGDMNNLRFWNRALNEEEVLALCDGPTELRGEGSEETATLTIYPNPAVDYIEISQPDAASISIYDDLGRCVSSVLNATRVDVHSLHPGMFLARITFIDGTFTIVRFSKQ